MRDMRVVSFLACLFSSSLLSLPASAKPVEADALCTRADDYIDSTVTFSDRIRTTKLSFSPGEEELGFRKDTHLKLILVDSCLVAFVAKTPQNEALVEAAAKGVPVQIEGVVHTAKVARRDIEVMGENVDITVHRPPESLAFVDVALIHLGAYRIAKGITYRTVAANTLTGAGEGSDVRVKTTFEGMSFRRSFTPRDAALSVTADNTIKVVGLVAGGVVYVQRTPANTALLLELQRGDTIVVVGRLAPTAPGVEKIILADAVRVLPTP
jgi:hypothetical protein